ncbi:heavy metal translocatin [Crassisporium funariophilum]|nr:heavy metal translocatin [Crassisporium funariophilum]
MVEGIGSNMGNQWENIKISKESTVVGHDTGGVSTSSFVQLAVGGMTCAACVGAIADAVSELEGVSDISVNLLGKSASAVVIRSALVESIVTCVEDIGYECQVISVTPVKSAKASEKVNEAPNVRTVGVEVLGLKTIPKAILAALANGELSSRVEILKSFTKHPDNVLLLSYTPSAPTFTIRTILAALSNATSPPVTLSLWHSPSTDEVARRMHREEQRNLLLRLTVAVVTAIPTFIIGIVYMSLLGKQDSGRRFFEETVWAGQISRGEWALFILATPVMFYSAEGFHRRSLKELWVLWRPKSRVSLIYRFTRFGSMNLLISLGVSVAYFASIAELAMSAGRDPNDTSFSTDSTTYFDSVVFLTMFLLIGRYIEAFSKHHAANSVSLLTKLQGSEALLLNSNSISSSTTSLTQSEDQEKQCSNPLSDSMVEKVSVDLLEVGDIVRVPSGATPPADGTIVSLETTHFDESSLTGESRSVTKTTGDHVFGGTINKLRVIDVRLDAVGGETMLEKIIEVVRQGQTRKAPVERLADLLTSYFVPVVTTLAIVTWIIWLSLGQSGVLPPDTLSGSVGGWPVWSLEFAIAVFVIACPCGIGLAAPTALLVGSGLSAKHGILVRGGGEAFQDASKIDIMVFDKTGTLTEGIEPSVTDVILPLRLSGGGADDQALNEDAKTQRRQISSIVLHLTSASSHPLCVALRRYFQGEETLPMVANDIEELPGQGMKGTFRYHIGETSTTEFKALMGNEAWLYENGAVPDQRASEFLYRTKLEGKSVILLAIAEDNSDTLPSFIKGRSSIAALFAVADPIRAEAPYVIAQLHSQGIETWMISGDNEITARAVAKSVGIPSENVIAGVLPQQKAAKIEWLKALPSRSVRNRDRGERKDSKQRRRVVAMVGDGINDAPALTVADVGIAIGSGSDIALSSAKFVLLSSNLQSLLTLTDLSRKVFNRIKFNFGWAIVYNLIALPIAAGVIYPAGQTRLNPVWSSLAMALSSTSVVCSSLLLRLYRPPASMDSNDTSTIREDAKLEV